MLKITNVCKEYKTYYSRVQALKNVSFSVGRGELVALVGKSGCGKTSLLNIIAGLLMATSGEIEYNGQLITDMSSKQLLNYRRNHIGVILQNFSLLNDRTVYQNIELPLRIHNVEKSKRRELIYKYLKDMGIEDKMDSFPEQLSGGQKQRVAIARALICEPDIILADEPTGALDDYNSKQILSMLRKIADSGKIVIMSTHNMDFVSDCDKCITMSDGEIINEE